MANYATLKAAITTAIKQNGNNEITGNLLQQQLLAMINSLGVGYQYAGIATPATNPGTPDQNVFYLASTAGTYTNFGGLVLADGEIAILKYNGAWSKDSTGAASLEMVNLLGQQVEKITPRVVNVSDTITNDKDYPILLQSGDKLKWKATPESGTIVEVYLIRSLNPLDYEQIPIEGELIAEEDDFKILRFYYRSGTGNTSIEYEIVPKFVVEENNNIQNLSIDVEKITPRVVNVLDTINTTKDFPLVTRIGDKLQWNVVPSSGAFIIVYLMRENDTYIQLDNSGEVILEDSFNRLRIYYYGGDGITTNVNYNIIPNYISELQKRVDNIELYVPIRFESHKTIDKDYIGEVYDIPMLPKKGLVIKYDISLSSSFYWYIYMIRTLSPLSYELMVQGVGSSSGEFEIDENDFTLFRLYKYTSSENNPDVSLITELYTPEVLPSDAVMCLPKKVFAMKGLPYNIYKESIMPSPDSKIDMFVYPMTDSNFDAELIQRGAVCRLGNLKDTTLRIGLCYDMIHRLIHKDLSVVWGDAETPITKKVNIIGDSITNRGAGYYSKMAAQHIGCTINTFGTITNAHSIQGEGREGWSFANFIGKSNICGSGTITPQGSGSASLLKNPFLREATGTDLQNYPEYCFPSTGAELEIPYSEDATQGTYYIFDYQYYLNRWSGDEIPDVVTIALGTNDILSNFSVTDIIDYAEWMVQRIISALPNIKIGIIPSPAWGASYDFKTKVIPYIEGIKSAFSSMQNVDIIGMWCFLSRYFAFGLNTAQNTILNPSTDSTPYIDNIHFDSGDGGEKTYIEYGKVLASFILNV